MTPLLLALLILLPSPKPGHRVHDLGNLLSSAQERYLETLSRDLDAATSAELAVVTVASLEGMTVDEYANALFNEWGIGKSGHNSGVMLLVAPRERRMRIEVGYGLEPLLTDGLCGEIADQAIVPLFKRGDMAGGIVAGADEIARVLRENPEEAGGVAGSAPASVSSRSSSLSDPQTWHFAVIASSLIFFILGGLLSRRQSYPFWIFGAASLGAAVPVIGDLLLTLRSLSSPLDDNSLSSLMWLGGTGAGALWAFGYNISRFLRFGPHACRKCGARLELLDETKDDAHLTASQKLEEKLGSIDYDVWICPSCLEKDVVGYTALFSDYSNCPKCSHCTYHEESTVITHATTLSTGQRRIDGRCASCKHAGTRYETIPRITQSSSGGGGSSSGGGSFGGGSSGGGGASRGW